MIQSDTLPEINWLIKLSDHIWKWGIILASDGVFGQCEQSQ